jgi:hypothetical protein
LAGHVLFETGIRRVGSKESGFFYHYPGTNEAVLEERVLARIKNLGSLRGILMGVSGRLGRTRRAFDCPPQFARSAPTS